MQGTLSIVTSREIAGYREVEGAGGGMAGKAGLSLEMVGSPLSELWLSSLPAGINRYDYALYTRGGCRLFQDGVDTY